MSCERAASNLFAMQNHVDLLVCILLARASDRPHTHTHTTHKTKTSPHDDPPLTSLLGYLSRDLSTQTRSFSLLFSTIYYLKIGKHPMVESYLK
jgi:hypothetical protein